MPSNYENAKIEVDKAKEELRLAGIELESQSVRFLELRVKKQRIDKELESVKRDYELALNIHGRAVNDLSVKSSYLEMAEKETQDAN